MRFASLILTLHFAIAHQTTTESIRSPSSELARIVEDIVSDSMYVGNHRLYTHFPITTVSVDFTVADQT